MRRSLLLLPALLLLAPAAAADELTVDPNPVLVTAFFRGVELHVKGTAQHASAVCVTVSGQTTHQKLNRKGRLGPLWANVGTVVVSEVPAVYFVACSAPPGGLLDRAEVDRHLLDLEAVGRRAIIEPATDLDLIREQYFKLKRSEQLYGSFPNAVRLTSSNDFDAVIPWPDSAPANDYSVRAFAIHDRAVELIGERTLTVKLDGMPKHIAYLAFERSALYGLMSVGIALAVGFLIGLVVKKGASH